MQEVLFTLKYFQLAEGSVTQSFNTQLKSDFALHWLAGACQELLGPQLGPQNLKGAVHTDAWGSSALARALHA